MQELLNNLLNWATTTGIKIIIALILLFISFKVINFVAKRIIKNGEKKNLDKTITKTLAYVVKLGAKVIVCVCLIAYLGIDTSAITALIASFGVCIGLAVNGTLSNLAGGVLILVTRPFKIDDFIEAQGVSGVVADIHITSTKIITVDNKVIYVPNAPLANGNIVNYSEKDTRRVDLDFSIAFDADAAKAQKLVADVLAAHEMVLKDPAIFVRLGEPTNSALVIKSRAWVKSEDYWTVYFDVLANVKEAFGANGIEVPHNQVDVHIKND